MKLILDFDDTIFDAKSFKEESLFNPNTYNVFDMIISRADIREIYAEYRRESNIFNIRDFVKRVSASTNSEVDIDKVLFNLSSSIKKYVKKEFLTIIEKAGRENVFILSQGDEEFQLFKINNSNLSDKVDRVHIVAQDKADKVREWCNVWSGEDVVFVDDKYSNLLKEDIPLNLRQVYVGERDKVEQSEAEISGDFFIEMLYNDDNTKIESLFSVIISNESKGELWRDKMI